MTQDAPHAEILEHMARFFGPVDELGIHEILPTTGISIHFIKPGEGQDSLVAFTAGMSDRPQAVPQGADAYRYTELMIQLPASWRYGPEAMDDPEAFWPIERLKQVAWYPHDCDTWLGGPYAIISSDDPPEPLGPGTDLSCLLLLHMKDEAGTIACGDGRNVALYMVIPLYTEERDLQIREGINALLVRLQERGVPFELDPKRPNAALG